MKRYAVLLLAFLLMAGCVRAHPKATGKWTPDRPHPTREEILALAKEGGIVETPDMPLALEIMPRIVMSYSDFKLTCRLPRSVEEGKYHFGVPTIFDHEGDINKREFVKYLRAGCEPIQAFCEYSEYKSPLGYQKIVRKVLNIEPVGDCR